MRQVRPAFVISSFQRHRRFVFPVQPDLSAIGQSRPTAPGIDIHLQKAMLGRLDLVFQQGPEIAKRLHPALNPPRTFGQKVDTFRADRPHSPVPAQEIAFAKEGGGKFGLGLGV